MTSVSRVFIGSYMIRDNERSVGFKTRKIVSDDGNSGTLIGYDLKPDPLNYNRFIHVAGDVNLKGVVLPDVNLLVDLDGFMSGCFNGIVVRAEGRLRWHSAALREGKNVTIFILERVSLEKPVRDLNIDVSALRLNIGGSDWITNREKRNKGKNSKFEEGKTVTNTVVKNQEIGASKKLTKKTARKALQVEAPVVEESSVSASGDVSMIEIVGDLFKVCSMGCLMSCISVFFP